MPATEQETTMTDTKAIEKALDMAQEHEQLVDRRAGGLGDYSPAAAAARSALL